MRTLYLLPALLVLACATTPVHPSVVTMSADAVPAFVPDCYVSPEGAYLCDHMAAASGVSVSPRGASLTSLLEGQAQPPVGTPSYAEQAFSLTLNAPSGSNAFVLNQGAKLCLNGSSCTVAMFADSSANLFTGKIVSNAGNGTNGLTCQNNGCRVDLGIGANDFIDSDGTTIRFGGGSGNLNATVAEVGAVRSNAAGASAKIEGRVTDSASAVSVIADTNGVTYATAGAKLLSIRNNGVEKVYVDKDGNIGSSSAQLQFNGVVANSAQTLLLKGQQADSASAVGAIVDNSVSLVTAGAKLFSVRNNGTEKANFSKDGDLSAAWGIFSGSVTAGSPAKATISGVNGKITLDAIDSSGTPGAATINKPSGQVAVAAASNSVVVTNSLVSTTSIVQVVIQTNDATCNYVDSVVPASGSFTVLLSANCTAATKLGFVVFN